MRSWKKLWPRPKMEDFICVDRDKLLACKATVALQIQGPEIGKDYDGKVMTIKDYGAFVDIAPGVSGLVHVSEIANERVQDINEYVAEGDNMKVRVLEIDRMGRIKLSAKAVEPVNKKA